ncbi:MAG: hypothetical protein INQ03_24280 [Candidatus Heimdallarchaeota archaeon]|nr:hypothetical protein [Candidatus Heimdallarchaeota archaeon]
MSDLLGTLFTFIWVLLFLFSSEFLSRTGKISKETSRKIIHISVGHVLFFIPLFDTVWIAAGIPFLFVAGNFMLSTNSPIEKLRLETFKAGHAWGTVLYPLSLSFVVFFLFDTPYLMFVAFFPLVYGDGLAAVIGPKFPGKEYLLYNGTKSVGGTITVLLASFTSIIISISLLNQFYTLGLLISEGFLLSVLLISVMGTIVEFFSPKGMDNLFLPLILLGVILLPIGLF